jgi:hypothetical protein
MGKNMKDALAFVKRYPGWHSWDKYCRATKDALCKLEQHGLIETNNFQQFRYARQ